VSVIDTVTNMVVGSPITVGSSPSGIAITPCPQLEAVVQGDGRTVVVSGSAFAPSSRLTVTIAAETLGTVTARSTGTFQRSFTVPCTVPAGEHTITATAPSGQRASTSVTLRSCAEPTPARVQPNFTG
jgi:DNA-binding beta-propeller fold protein YncE